MQRPLVLAPQSARARRRAVVAQRGRAPAVQPAEWVHEGAQGVRTRAGARAGRRGGRRTQAPPRAAAVARQKKQRAKQQATAAAPRRLLAQGRIVRPPSTMAPALPLCIPVRDWLLSIDIEEAKRKYGPVAAGACCGAAWAVFADMVSTREGGDFGAGQVLPGVGATVSALLLNMVHRDEISESSGSWDQQRAQRVKVFLLLCYILSAASALAAVFVMASVLPPDRRSTDGVAVILQTVLMLGSGLIFFKTRASEEDDGSGYGVALVGL